jgi:hypothetical protein
MHWRALAPGLTLAVALLVGTAPARAQVEETPDAMIERALALRDAGNDVDAHDLIVRAQALSPTPRNTAQLGLVEQALGLFVLSEQHLVQALAAADDSWIRRRRARLEQSLGLVRQRLGSVDLLTSVPGATVSIGGEVVGVTPFAAPIRVEIGTIPAEVSLDGYRTQTVSLVVTANALNRQTVRLLPNPPVAPLPAVTTDAPVVVASPPVLPPPTTPVRAAQPEPGDPPTPVEPSGGGSITSRWWFWTILGVVVAGGGVALAVALSSDSVTNAPPIPGDEPAGGVIQTLSLSQW